MGWAGGLIVQPLPPHTQCEKSEVDNKSRRGNFTLYRTQVLYLERRTIRRNYVFWAISKSAAVGKKMMAESERSSKFMLLQQSNNEKVCHYLKVVTRWKDIRD